uniref:Conserved oligomeric Golgi complex subunit 4 n=1 Tax=Eutreptiella gymnastica TaxID=73025 RepID=A0A7S1NEH3_9EUGL|mmetsp:Transcript_19564/g.34712  ORF Transcript_19564/g.34712 Transcript_19564/m.34712 type:complete len:759 (+) Transcript_19564:122-2398(+)
MTVTAERRKYYEDLVAKIQECDAQKEQKCKEIYDLIRNKEEMEIQEELLADLRRHQLHHAKDKTMQIARTISDAAKLANKSSQRVKELDEIKDRVREALELVEGISSQQSSIEKVTQALGTKDYETAVSYVNRYFETEKQLKAVEEVADLNSSAASAQIRMERDKLQDTIRTEYTEAVKKGEEEAIMRFSKLFMPLDMADEGLGLYIKYVAGTIDDELAKFVRENVKKVETKDGDGTYLAILARVLDCAAATLECQEEHIRTYFGPTGLREFYVQVNKEASKQMAPILESIIKVATPLSSGGSNVEPQDIDSMLEEIAHLSKTCYVYYHFVADHFAKAVEEAASGKMDHKEDEVATATAKKKPAKKTLPSFVLECEAMTSLQTILSMYIPMQRDYLQAAFTKAAALDSGKKKEKDAGTGTLETKMPSLANMTGALGLAQQAQDDDAATAQGSGTSLIEDVFYMLRIACHRVIQCRNPMIISAVFNVIVDLLRDSLLGEIQRNVRVSKEQARPTYKTMQWINNLERSTEYIVKLHKEVTNLLQRQKRNLDEAEISKIIEVAFEIKVTADTYGHQRETYLNKVIQIIETQLKARGLAELEELDYRIEEAQFLNNEINDPWALTALQTWDMILEPFRKGLNEKNFEEVILEVINFVTQQLETIACQKAFTQYGGLQLDKDVRAIRNYFTEKTDKPVRDKFTRLSHISNILSLDKVSEMYDLWGSGSGSNPMVWRLTCAEVKAVLALRVDFEQAAINALKLK